MGDVPFSVYFHLALFLQPTVKAGCIVSETVFDQLPVASQYVGKISSKVLTGHILTKDVRSYVCTLG